LHRQTWSPTLSIPSPQPCVLCSLQGQQASLADVISFPEHGYLKAKGLPTEQRFDRAGQLAVKVLNRYPHLIQQLGSTNDPVSAWTILRNVIARQLEQHLPDEPATVEQDLAQHSCDCDTRLGNP
jgi:hypothetical protein